MMAVNYSQPPSYAGPTGARGYPEPPVAEERPLGELFANLSSQLSLLLQKEVQLAKLEVQDQAAKAAKAGAMLGATAVVAFLASILVSFAAAWGLAEVIPTGFAFLAVGVLYAILAAILFSQGRRRMRQVRPVPMQTVETLKGDVEVAKDSVSRGMSAPPSGTSIGKGAYK